MVAWIGYFMLAEVFVVLPLLLIFELYLTMKNERAKWYTKLVLFFLLTAYVGCISVVLGAVQAAEPFDIWNQERAFFWGIFENALASHDTLSAAAKAMESEYGDISQCIGLIVLQYHVAALVGIIGGVSLLIASAFGLFFRRKYVPLCTVLLLIAGNGLLGYGISRLTFAEGTDANLNHLLYEQKALMAKFQNTKSVLTNQEIASLVEKHKNKRLQKEYLGQLKEMIEGKPPQ